MPDDEQHDEELDEFESFHLDQEDLDILDALEATSTKPSKLNAQSPIIELDDGKDSDDLLLDEEDDWDDPSLLNQVMEAESAIMHRSKKSGTSLYSRGALSKPGVIGQSQGVCASSSPRNGNTNRGTRQLTLFGDVLPMQSSQGLLLVAKKAHTATGTASQKVRDALHSRDHRFQTEGRAKRKEWDRSQPINVKKSNTSSFLDEERDGDDWGEEDDNDMDAFISAPPPLEPEGLKRMKIPIDRVAAKSWIYPTNKEKRDYQFNIVQRALFNNVLVALPTGLGKTLIAAVVILNYYRWFPTGKIIFVAPTKPLVAQQQQACHGICGLPWDCAVEMTGGTKANLRGDEWKTKRIFYMTPQTFENDLCSTAVDAEDVVCVVVDEAHRATGNYAYGKVIKWITRRNPFFRVLALTATPGNKPEKVQEVIDNLHINLIEIRTEEAVDIRKYVHTKTEDPVVVPLGGIVKELKDLFVKLMRPLLETLNKNGLYNVKDPASVAPYALTAMYKDSHKRTIINQRKLFNQVRELGEMARALEYLIRYSVDMFMERLTDMQSGSSDKGKKTVTKRQMGKSRDNAVIRDIERLYEEAQKKEGKVRHPKMEYLQNVVAAHFASEEEQGRRADTRIMVFCQFRECVLEIVDLLNEHNGIDATVFVGQAADNKGNKGMRQKDQEQTIQDFKSGKFNVLVATSIGEEGLDIGEVDLIVNYEAVKNSVRMLQRIGRTGRKRNGRIVVLMSEGLEENNWQHSKDNHRIIQDDLINGSHLELFDDVERLVPEDITSVCILQDVDQPAFEPSLIRAPTREKKVPKAKRNTDPLRNIPKNGLRGFLKVSEMRRKKTGKSLREGESQSPGPALSTCSSGSEKGDDDDDGKEDKRVPVAGLSRATLEAALLSEESDDDEHLQKGFVFRAKMGASVKEKSTPLSVPSSARKSGRRLGTGRAPSQRSLESRGSASSLVNMNLLSSSPVCCNVEAQTSAKVRSSLLQEGTILEVESDDDEDEVETTTATPMEKRTTGASTPSSPVKRSRRTRLHPLVARLAAELGDSSDDDDDGEITKGAETHEQKEGEGEEEEEERVSLDSTNAPTRRRTANPMRKQAVRIPSSSPTSSSAAPAITAHRNGTLKRRSREGVESEREEEDDDVIPKPIKQVKKKKRTIRGSPTSRRLFQYEADRSTDEEIHGEKDEQDDGQDTDEADSSDREHVGDFAPTQAPRGYKQDAVYLQSLHSQANITPFRTRPKGIMTGYQMGLDSEQVRRIIQDTPRRHRHHTGGGVEEEEEEEEQDEEYEKDSFVCSDEDLLFESEPQSSQL
ncbi:hypothetical protein CBS101457_004130 [Exobasidium rhododendri]|nr:hypothetical protein CBS101457_004130 [Exobasidium rhododendri]